MLFIFLGACVWFAALCALDHDARRYRTIARRLQPAVAALNGSTSGAMSREIVYQRRPRLRGFAALFVCPKCEKRYYFGPNDFVACAHGKEAAEQLWCCAGVSLTHDIVVVTRDLVPLLRKLQFSFGDEPGVTVTSNEGHGP